MRRRSSGGRMVRVGMALVVALISLCGYFFTRSENPITGEVQHVDLTPQQEIALGLQAAPEMIDQHQGLHPDSRAQALVDEIGLELVSAINSTQNPYRFEFHLGTTIK